VLGAQLPQAWQSFERRIGDTSLGERLLRILREAQPSGSNVAAEMGRIAFMLGSAVLDLILVLIAGIFLAADPATYRSGLAKLFPKGRQRQVFATLNASGGALRLWLLGQMISMTVIGVLVGVPSPLMLGLIAGLAEFVPVVGPFIAAVPGLLLALSEGPQTALWALLVYVVIQQFESNLVTPMVEKSVVAIPPAVTLFAVLALGVIFGPLGILLAAPLSVVLFVAVKKLYVRDALGHEVEVPGEEGAD
jgi:predicted PurR-regulated permease PerM